MSQRVLSLAGVLLLVSGEAVAAATPSAVKGPYLQHVSSDGVEVRVELGVAAPASLEVKDVRDALRRIDDASATSFHVLRATGLQPAQHYRYDVRVGGAIAGSGEFDTAPQDGTDAPVSFVLYGDDRTDHAAHEAVIRAIQHESFDFLVHTGDFVQQGGVAEQWQRVFDIERQLLRDHCVFACIGNHELFEDSAAARYEQYFGPSPDAAGRLYGTFRWGPTRFFLLNAFESWSGGERAWLESALRSADAEKDLVWRVAVIHHSPWSAGPHGENKRLLGAHVDDLLVEHHVDLVLAGHDHIYERGAFKGLKYVISGGGGAPLYTDLSPQPSTRKVESSYHYVVFTATRQRLAMTAKRVDGSFIESCGFAAGGGWDCDAKSGPASTPSPPVVATSSRPASNGRCGCVVPGRGGTLDLHEFALAVAATGLVVARRARRGS